MSVALPFLSLTLPFGRVTEFIKFACRIDEGKLQQATKTLLLATCRVETFSLSAQHAKISPLRAVLPRLLKLLRVATISDGDIEDTIGNLPERAN